MNTTGKLQVSFKMSVVPAELMLLRGVYKALALHWSFCVDKASFNGKNPMQFTEVTTNISQHSYFCQHGKIKQRYHAAAQG